jgi:hypothetical protein
MSSLGIATSFDSLAPSDAADIQVDAAVIEGWSWCGSSSWGGSG